MTETLIGNLTPADPADTISVAVTLPDGNTIPPPPITEKGEAGFMSNPGNATVVVTATTPYGVKTSSDPITVVVPDTARVPVVPTPSFTFAVPA